ncbi:MAG: carboxypeptidase regulatory-like domain-containing protein, partial [Bacteroidota bacterium]
MSTRPIIGALGALMLLVLAGTPAFAQGVTTAGLSGFVLDQTGEPLPGANVIAVHVPSGTTYGAATRTGGSYIIPNMRVGGPYTITASYIGYQQQVEENISLSLGQTLRLDFALVPDDVALGDVEVTAMADDVLNGDRTGAATFIDPQAVTQLPTVSRSTRDLTRVDPRSDGNFSFGGRNWLYNNVTLDGSYFNNPFGLDDPAPGGQAGAEPVPYDAIEQVQVSIAPFDVREGGFTGASINQVTKSGTNRLQGSVYTFYRDENLIGNTVSGNEVLANPDLGFNQYGISLGGPIFRDKLFFFVNGELSRRDDPGTNFLADTDGSVGFGESRATAADLNAISARLLDAYGYDTGAFDNYLLATDNDKLLVKLDWNINANNNASFRWNYLDSFRDLPVNPAAISFANAGRGPNQTSLPFQNSGYRINNELNSFAFELNSRATTFSNRFFASYNRFRDFREPLSTPFPTIEIIEDGITYTTAGHEPFSIHNILDQDVVQVTNNFSVFAGRHILTFGGNFEYFSFFNSFNLFRHGLFQLPYFLDFEGDQIPNGSTFFSVDQFLDVTDPNLPLCGSDDGMGGVFQLADAGTTCRVDLNGMVTPESQVFKGERINVGQAAFYVQDEFLVSPRLNLTFGLRVDMPFYNNDLTANPFSTGLTALDENDQDEVVDQASLPGTKVLFSPRFGFNWSETEDRSVQVRGGTGIFTGRVPFVWVGNVISNPGANPNLPSEGEFTVPEAEDEGLDILNDDSTPTQSFDLNAMDEDFTFPQVWTTNLALDVDLGAGFLGTLEAIYSKDINGVFLRNADLRTPLRNLPSVGGRPYFGAQEGGAELNPDGGAGIYVIDNTDEGYSFSFTTQLRKSFGDNVNTSIAYAYTEAENIFNTTEIASVLFSSNPVQGDPNQPGLSFSQAGQPHRFVGTATVRFPWSDLFTTQLGVFATVAKGNQYLYAGGNRYSFVYSGDVNGDGFAGNDLLYVPRDANDINLVDIVDGNGNVVASAADQWNRLNAFIEQDDYLSTQRGQITERNGAINPWYMNVDLRILQDIGVMVAGVPNRIQLSFDLLNVANFLNSDWGVRKIANPAATAPLTLVGFEGGEPEFNFTGPDETFIDDPSEFSRW